MLACWLFELFCCVVLVCGLLRVFLLVCFIVLAGLLFVFKLGVLYLVNSVVL